MNIIIVEYPGYSIYPCEDPESKIFFNNALIVYDWIKKNLKPLMIKFLFMEDP
jgi:hypothetical protein